METNKELIMHNLHEEVSRLAESTRQKVKQNLNDVAEIAQDLGDPRGPSDYSEKDLQNQEEKLVKALVRAGLTQDRAERMADDWSHVNMADASDGAIRSAPHDTPEQYYKKVIAALNQRTRRATPRRPSRTSSRPG
jgi:hypothetical protein